MPEFDLGAILAKVAGVIVLGLGLGIFTEVIIEYFLKPLIQLLPKISDHAKGLLIKYCVLVAGFLFSWYVGYDLWTPLLTEFGVILATPLVGPVASAVMVGGGAPLIHMFIERWRGGESMRTTGIHPPQA